MAQQINVVRMGPPDRGGTLTPLPPSGEAMPPSVGAVEQLIDDSGSQITLEFERQPSADSYEYLRDYLDFKLKRIKQKNA